MRSSQPLTGANRKRCKEDELLLQAVIDSSELGYIMDLRSAQQAQQARMTGGGFESKSCYNHWKRLHRLHERWAGVVQYVFPKSDLQYDTTYLKTGCTSKTYVMCIYRGKVLQESLIKLVEACADSSHSVDRWLSKLENSKWLSHVHIALSTAGLIAECVERWAYMCNLRGCVCSDISKLITFSLFDYAWLWNVSRWSVL